MDKNENTDFKKSDYRTAKQLAHELNIDEATARKTLKRAYLRGTTLLVQAGHTRAPRPLVIISKYTHANIANDIQYRLHPLGLNEFKKLLQKGK
ncbi:MAG: hypothetical protein IJY99_00590 [Alphaproteobacteria bacterium]|nr:hypothetical protein [Alphaproteobacteria bacterium]